MVPKQANIVQAEFFHARMDGSLEEMLADAFTRITDNLPLALSGVEVNPGVKTVVRFLDRHDILTNYAFRVDALRRKEEALYDALCQAEGRWRRWWLNFRHRQVLGRRMYLAETAATVAAEQFRRAAEEGQEIAVERLGHYFRFAESTEVHELVEQVRKATGAWLFIFKPNYLLADSNTSVVRVT